MADGQGMVQLREASESDLGEVVRVHVAAFPDFFMTDLGAKFLGAYYRLVLGYSRHILVVAVDRGGRLVGFAAGFLDPPSFYRLLGSQRMRLGIASLPALLSRPWLLTRLLANRRRVRELAASRGPEDQSVRAELASIAVDPAAVRRGYGRRLIIEFCRRAGAEGSREVYLVTEKNQNGAAHCFYQSIGFRNANTLQWSKRRVMVEYRIDPGSAR